MSWRAITEDDLTASLSAAEIDAYRKSSQFGDPVEAQLRSVAAYVRGVVRSSPARVRLAANPLALPESLIVPAMDYLRFGVLARCNIVVNESRTLAYNKACELLSSSTRCAGASSSRSPTARTRTPSPPPVPRSPRPHVRHGYWTD